MCTKFLRLTLFNENFAAVEMLQSKIAFSKQTHIGFIVFESSKLHMHYNVMQPYFKENLQLNYADTQSLIYTIDKKVFTILCENFQSNYKPKNPHKILPVNARVMGLMKDELGGQCIHR